MRVSSDTRSDRSLIVPSSQKATEGSSGSAMRIMLPLVVLRFGMAIHSKGYSASI